MKNEVSLQGSCKPGAKGGHNPGEAVAQQLSGAMTGIFDSLAIIRQRQGHELAVRSIQKI